MRSFLFTLMLLALSASARAATVRVLNVNGGIDPATAEYVDLGVRAANDSPDSVLVVIQMDTPGGLVDSMESIVQRLLASRVPVCVFVTPPGARAASAGAVIALSADLIAMAPATNIGAATPIDGLTGKDLSRKIVNDSAARARALAVQRHRPAKWAQQIVTSATSTTVDEALRLGLADVKASDIGELLRKLDGRKVRGNALSLSAARVEVDDMPFRLGVLHLLANPNVGYILMLVAIYGLIAELSHPGAVFPGVAGAICAVLAFYSMAILTVNVAGLLLIVLAVGLFIGDAVMAAHGTLAFGGVVAFVFGSLMLVRSPLGTVSPALIAGATITTTAFFLVLITLAVRTRFRPAAMGREAIAGKTAVARTPIEPGSPGRVLFEGALWKAVCADAIDKGRTVEVVGIDGLTLTVKPIR
ncbi:MAG TPA: nodulation protein NfeD [Armatimonadota bacterium]|jgi:membrane-bound serine protease (ClpP class)